ncbi:A24 family peptidase [Planotetraspora sp. A-T 1434]|uniref:prepilin peptidase n=1 Tax=Planotetraspora sp. A-T 1434 TaxID=2979219 RepID=UPI0021C0A96B|nr:A24 family peptidase [Planotetraspora sp. A-T 1434]MCT9929396.1 A24 family peptidase [Planotetraspora sp. A-T 1434]
MALLLAVILGLIAGSYVRELAGGFGIDPDDTRKEAREAYAYAIRIVPVPRPPYLIEAATAVAAGLVTWGLQDDHQHNGWLLAAWLYAAVAGVTLAVIDWRIWRLPDAIVVPSYPIVVALLVPSGHLMGAVTAGCAIGGVYALLWFGRPAALGFGDVKLAGLIGLLTGALGVQAALVAGLGGHFLGALYAAGLLITKRATRKSEFPFGPFMLVAALVAVLVHA